MRKSKVKEKIRRGEPTFGSWIMIGNIASAEILSQTGFDWITVDMEHTAIDYATLQTLVLAIQSNGAEALVRIENNDPVVIKRVLDCGADGIIVPTVSSAVEAQRAVAAAKYPPQGIRGISLGRATGYGHHFDDYFHSINDEVIVVVQIEHYQGVEEIDSIVSTEGVDGVLIGPYDLSGSMGIVAQFDHPKMTAARKKVVEAVQRAGIGLGIHEVNPDPESIKALLEEGFNFIACSIDTLFLSHASGAVLQSIRKLLPSE